MTWFTDSPYEKMMTQKPGHGRHGDSKPPVPRSPACIGCSYGKNLLCIGYCIKSIKKPKNIDK